MGSETSAFTRWRPWLLFWLLELPQLLLKQDMDMVVMEVMEDPMEAMVDIEVMEAMVMEREMLSQVMVMVVMEDLMEVMVDTEAMGMVVMDMESKHLRTDTTYNAQ